MLSGGVFQNELLLEDLNCLLAGGPSSLDQPCGPAKRWGNQPRTSRPGGFGRFDPIERPDVAIEPSYA